MPGARGALSAGSGKSDRVRGTSPRSYLRLVTAAPDPVESWMSSIHGALSPNTERAFRTDSDHYRAWCIERKIDPWPVRAIVLARYIDCMASRHAPATVRRKVSSLVSICRAVGWKNPQKRAAVNLALKRMYQRKGRRQDQARGLTWALRKRMISASGSRLIDARNRAMVAVSYDALLRRSELVSLQVSDLVRESDDSATLFVRKSKTDPEGEGAVLFLARDTVKLLREWLQRSGIVGGYVFRSVQKGGHLGGKLSGSQVPRIFKSMAKKAGLGKNIVAGLSGHSARVGAVQDMIASGIELPAIMQAGRWKSTAMVHRYGERILARRSGSAQLAKIQKRTSKTS